MFPEVHSALKLDQHPVAGKRINIVEEDVDMAGFLVHHFVSHAVKSGSDVLLVGLDQTLGHYTGIGLKLGVDLIKLQKSKQFVFLDLLKYVSANYVTMEENDDVIGTAAAASFVKTKSLRSLYLTIRQQCEELKKGQGQNQRPLTIIVDKLTLLSSLGVPLGEIVTFAQYLQALALEQGATLVTLSRGHSSRDLGSRYKDEMELDLGDSGGGSCDSLVAFLDHTSHLTVVVWPLMTGHSEVVTGNFLFSWNDQSGGETGRYQYNTEEKNVKVFALGASSAVL